MWRCPSWKASARVPFGCVEYSFSCTFTSIPPSWSMNTPSETSSKDTIRSMSIPIMFSTVICCSACWPLESALPIRSKSFAPGIGASVPTGRNSVTGFLPFLSMPNSVSAVACPVGSPCDVMATSTVFCGSADAPAAGFPLCVALRATKNAPAPATAKMTTMTKPRFQTRRRRSDFRRFERVPGSCWITVLNDRARSSRCIPQPRREPGSGSAGFHARAAAHRSN